MANKKEQTEAQKKTRFDGEKSNRNVRGNSKVRIQKSKLRDTAAKLRELESKCLENIKNSVEGKEVEPKQLDSSKWVINSIISLDRAASQEEAALTKIRLEGKRDDSDEDEQEVAEIVKLVPRLKLTFDEPVEKKDD
jgi:hypothetical protein